MGSKWEDVCPYCGAKYSELRTGLTFADVRAMLWTNSADSKDWRYKRRHSVLGKWCQIKQEMWNEHLMHCEQWYEENNAENEEDRESKQSSTEVLCKQPE